MEIRIVKESISKTDIKAIAEHQFGDFVKDPPIHKELAGGRWHTLSLAEQLGNIGSEVGRAGRAQACRKLSLRQYPEQA